MMHAQVQQAKYTHSTCKFRPCTCDQALQHAVQNADAQGRQSVEHVAERVLKAQRRTENNATLSQVPWRGRTLEDKVEYVPKIA